MRLLAMMQIFAAAIGAAMLGEVTHVDVKRVEDELNSETVEKYATVGCTVQDVADRFLVSDEFIRTRFPDELRRGWARHRITLRQAQWKYAITKGGAALLTWLGRNSLGQTHVPEKPGEPEPSIDEMTG